VTLYPILLKIGPIPIYGYGFMIAIGFLTGIFVIRRLAAQSKLEVEKIIDLSFWCLIAGFIGARALFVLTRYPEFLANPLEIFKIWEGGFVFFGGLLVGMPFGLWYLRKHRIPLWKGLDVIFPGLTIGHLFGRLGCLLAGCCYGRPTGSSFGIRLYSDLVDRSLQGILLHPTQLYEACSLGILFIGLLFVFKRKRFDGQVALTYLIAYPIIRSVIEVFRGDQIRGFVIEDFLSTSQFISLLVFLAATTALVIRLKEVQKKK
jgi:phosphatidylglycerol---prolipoprotein diacylglyceryl transferase